MKKQIFILVLLVFATFVCVNKSYGQYSNVLTGAPSYVPAAIPVKAICGNADALHPIPGTQYPYTVTVTNGGAAKIHWFVTSNPAFITAGSLNTAAIETVASSTHIQAAGTNYNDPNNTSNTINITWKSFPLTSNAFLVTYVKNEAGCTDNIKVYKIIPVHVFTLDVAALTAAGAANATKIDCVSPVVSASYDGTNVVMDYGANYVYFAVNAANFSHSWKPSFTLGATNVVGTTLAIDWAYPSQSYGATPAWHSTTLAAGIYTSTDAVFPTTSGATGVGATGESIIVRVTVDHNKNETINDVDLTLAVNGVMYDFAVTGYTNLLLGDVHNDATATVIGDCTGVDDFDNDIVTYKLSRRPTVVDAISDTPNATDFLPRN